MIWGAEEEGCLSLVEAFIMSIKYFSIFKARSHLKDTDTILILIEWRWKSRVKKHMLRYTDVSAYHLK